MSSGKYFAELTKKSLKTAFFFVLLVIGAFLVTTQIFTDVHAITIPTEEGAEGTEGGSGGSGVSGCGKHHVCTSDGTYWQYFKISNGTVSPSNSDTVLNADGSVTILRSGPYGGSWYAYGGTIDKVCSELGGYWRRGYVEHALLDKGHTIGIGDGISYRLIGLNPGDIGYKGIINSNGYLIAFGSDYLTTTLSYPSIYPEDDTLQKMYDHWTNIAKEKYDIQTQGINSVSWFCYGENMDASVQSNTHAWIKENESLADANWTDGKTDDDATYSVELGTVKTSDCNTVPSEDSREDKQVEVHLASYLKATGAKATNPVNVEFRIRRTVTGLSSSNISGWQEAYGPRTIELTSEDEVRLPDKFSDIKDQFLVTIPKNTPSGTRIRICEFIDYKKTADSTTYDGTTHACATITVTVGQEYVPPCLDPGFCEEINGIDIDDPVNYGNTAADVYVANYSSTDHMRELISTGTNKETVMNTAGRNRWDTSQNGGVYLDNWVFAKPGDSINFRHRLCSPAQEVTGYSLNEDYNGRDGKGDNGQGVWAGSTSYDFGLDSHTRNDTDHGGYSYDGRSAVNYKFTVTAEPNKSYVFKNTASVFASDSPSPLKVNVNGGPVSGAQYTPLDNESPVSFLPSDDRNEIGFRFFSPSRDVLTSYKCAFVPTSRNPFTNTSYQIPGFTEGFSNCGASRNTDGDTDKVGVGEEIAQKIYWNNIVGFEQLRGTDAVHKVCENKYFNSECPEQQYKNTRYNESWDRWGPAEGAGGCGTDPDGDVHCNRHDDPRAYSLLLDGANAYDKVKNARGAWWWHYSGCNTPSCSYTCCCDNSCGENGGECCYTGKCCSVTYLTLQDSYYRTAFWYDYSKAHGKEYETDEARVYTPYNFSTNKTISISNEQVIFGGSSVTSSWKYEILPKANPFTSTFDYATITPERSRMQVVEFTIKPDKDSPGVSENTNASVSDVCSYVRQENGEVTDCTVIQEDSGPFNPIGSYDGWDNHNSLWTSRKSATRVVPDLEAGTKYCVMIGVYPADSTNWETITEDSAGISLLKGMGMYGGSTWNISNPVCRTIAKKPTFQVWNGGIFSPAGIITSASKKEDAASIGHDYSNSLTTVFGSWDETLIVTNGTVRGMASGAGLGYNGEDGTSGGKNYGFALKGGVQDEVKHENVSTLTISNVDGTIGNSGIGSISTTIMQRLLTRYANLADSTNLDLNGQGMQFIRADGGSLSTIVSSALGSTNPAGSTTFNGDLIKGAIEERTDGVHKGEYGDNTLVIQVDGTLLIDTDICYGSCSSSYSTQQFRLDNVGGGESGWVNGGSTVLKTYGLEVDSISALPQILIFADNIVISGDVTRIDAWLITSEVVGSIDTCAGGPDDSRTCSQPLVINGPVFTKTLYLNRTSGSWPGGQKGKESGNVLNQNLSNDGSISPAEIFNLRSDVYLWAYNQAQRYTEAVVTYTRELAPRY